MNLPQRYPRLFVLLMHTAGALSILSAGAGYYFMMHAPLVATAAENTRQADRLSVLLRSSNQTIEKRRQKRERLAQLRQAIADIRSQAPAEANVEEFMGKASEIAEAEGVQIVDYRRGTGASHETHSQIELDLRCVGAYDGMCRFLASLEQMPRISAVSKLTLETQPGFSRIPFEVRFVLYYGLRESYVASTSASRKVSS